MTKLGQHDLDTNRYYHCINCGKNIPKYGYHYDGLRCIYCDSENVETIQGKRQGVTDNRMPLKEDK